MAQKTIAGQAVDVNDEGYLVDSSQWSKEIAAEMAKEEGIDLTDNGSVQDALDDSSRDSDTGQMNFDTLR